MKKTILVTGALIIGLISVSSFACPFSLDRNVNTNVKKKTTTVVPTAGHTQQK